MSSGGNRYGKALQGAADLRLLLRHWQEDVNFKKKGRHIFYTVDTSILQLFVAPNRHKPTLFFVEDTTELTSFVTVLADFIFFSLQKEPLLVISPHDVEMSGVFEAIARKVGKHIDVQTADVQELLTNTSGQSINQVIDVLIEKIPIVIEILSDGDQLGPMQELRRYQFLLQQHRLRHISREVTLPHPDRRKEVWVRIKKQSSEWYKWLNAAKGPGTTRTQLVRDAEVMAYLEWLNQEIAPDRAVHLIAFDKGIMTVADQRAAEGHPHFVRDPRYFLMASWQQSGSPAGDVAGWIDEAMLALCPKEKAYSSWLGEISADCESTPYALDDQAGVVIAQLSDRLAVYIREVSLSYVLHEPHDTSHASPSADRVRALIDFLRANQNSLEMILKQRIMETVYDIDRLAVVAGFYLIAEEDPSFRKILDRLASTGIPLSTVPRAPVWFRFFNTTIDQWAKNLHAAITGQGDVRVVAAAFDWPGSDLHKQYELRIVHAYLLSIIGNWRAAENLCRRAKAIADNAIGELFGHEAAYFRAVSLRHLAETVDDLHQAEEELMDAERRWQVHKPTFADPRFSVERHVQKFALWVIKHHAALAQKQIVPVAVVRELADIVRALWALRPLVEAEQDKLIRQHLALQLLVNAAEGILIEQHLLKRQASVTDAALYTWKGWLESDAGSIRKRSPLFVQMVLSLLDWSAQSYDDKERRRLAQAAHLAIRKYLPHASRAGEKAVLRGFLHVLEPGG
jgi:hypothetical protein